MIRAHMNYVAAVNKGGDGRPDFHARKACNYAEEAIQVFSPTLLSFSIITFAQSFFGCNVLGVPIPICLWSYLQFRDAGTSCLENVSPRNRWHYVDRIEKQVGWGT